MAKKKQDLYDAAEALLESAEQMVRHKVNRALGKPSELDMSAVDEREHDLLWKTLEPMLQNLSHRSELEVENVKDVMTLLKGGIITISEAKELMLIMKIKAEAISIETGPDGDASMPVFNLNLYPSSAEEKKDDTTDVTDVPDGK